MQLRGSSVPDMNGSPMNVSAILNYRVTDAVAFTYSVDNPNAFIQN
jgi:regulator of protease activity HflC (stomatin/prohibitin superfamily)